MLSLPRMPPLPPPSRRCLQLHSQQLAELRVAVGALLDAAALRDYLLAAGPWARPDAASAHIPSEALAAAHTAGVQVRRGGARGGERRGKD